MEEQDIKQQIRDFNNDETVRKLKARYENKSFPEILGVSRKELAHSNFLAWLLDPKESHLLGDFALRKLLEIIVYSPCKGKGVEISDGLSNSIIVSNYENSDVNVVRESVTKDKRGYIDLYITTKFKYPSDSYQNLSIVLENKVGAKEGKNQTIKYYNDKKDNSELVIYVYLTPISNYELKSGKVQDVDEHYIQINYQSIVDSILEPALEKHITEKTKSIINEYLHTMSGNLKETIMALPSKEQELLVSFLDKNEDLIKKAIDARVAMEQDPEILLEYKETQNSMNKSHGTRRLEIAIKNGRIKKGYVLVFNPQENDRNDVNEDDEVFFKAEVLGVNKLKWLARDGFEGTPTKIKDEIVKRQGYTGGYTGSAATYWKFEGKTIAQIADDILKNNQ